MTNESIINMTLIDLSALKSNQALTGLRIILE